MIKLIVNTSYFDGYRKYILEKIHSDISSDNVVFCCHVEFKWKKFICWKDLKEVREVLQTTSNLSGGESEMNRLMRTKPTCGYIWFDNKEQRLAFLKECLNKFK